MDGNILFFSMLFGIIGLGYFSYGKKHNPYFLVSGIGLMFFPYAVDTLSALIIIGLLLVVLPFVLTNFIAL
jgi:hypothetical protein